MNGTLTKLVKSGRRGEGAERGGQDKQIFQFLHFIIYNVTPNEITIILLTRFD